MPTQDAKSATFDARAAFMRSPSLHIRVHDPHDPDRHAGDHRFIDVALPATTCALAARDFLAVLLAAALRMVFIGSVMDELCEEPKECGASDFTLTAGLAGLVVVAYALAGYRGAELMRASAGAGAEVPPSSRSLVNLGRAIPAGTFALALAAGSLATGVAGAGTVAVRSAGKVLYCGVRDTITQWLNSNYGALTPNSQHPGHNLRLLDKDHRLVGRSDEAHKRYVADRITYATLLYTGLAIASAFSIDPLKAAIKARYGDGHWLMTDGPLVVTTTIIETLDIFAAGIATYLAARREGCTLTLDPSKSTPVPLATAVADHTGMRIGMLSMGDLASVARDLVEVDPHDVELDHPYKGIWRPLTKLLAGVALGITEVRGHIAVTGRSALGAPTPASLAPSAFAVEADDEPESGESRECQPLDHESALRIVSGAPCLYYQPPPIPGAPGQSPPAVPVNATYYDPDRGEVHCWSHEPFGPALPRESSDGRSRRTYTVAIPLAHLYYGGAVSPTSALDYVHIP